MSNPTSTIDADYIILCVEEWSKHIQEWVVEDKETVEAVHTLMVVVSFMNVVLSEDVT